MKKLLFLVSMSLLMYACHTHSHADGSHSHGDHSHDHPHPHKKKSKKGIDLDYVHQFPQDWVGSYTGALENCVYGNCTKLANSKLEIFPDSAKTGRWIWRSTYDSEQYGKIVKDYAIEEVSDKPFQFLFDEQNGITMRSYQIKNTVYTNYSLQDQYFSTAYTKIGDEILQELTIQPMTPHSFSVIPSFRDSTKTDTIFNYEPKMMQRAIFKPE